MVSLKKTSLDIILFIISFRELCVFRKKTNLALFLQCDKSSDDGNWSIEAECEFKLMSVNGRVSIRKGNCCFHRQNDKNRCGWSEFIDWNLMEKDYAVDDIIEI